MSLRLGWGIFPVVVLLVLGSLPWGSGVSILDRGESGSGGGHPLSGGDPPQGQLQSGSRVRSAARSPTPSGDGRASDLLRTDKAAPDCQDPSSPLYDPGANEIFVICLSSDSVTVISPTNNTIVANITVGDTFAAIPVPMAYDAATGEVFVSNYDDTSGDTVSVISDKTNTVVATVTVGADPSALVYDAGAGDVFVLNANSNDLSVISGTSNSVVATIPVGSGSSALVYDSGKGEVFVSNGNSGTVSVVSDTENRVVATIPVGTEPDQEIYDPAVGEVFVLDSGGTSVDVISDSTNTVVAAVAVGTPGFFPDGMAFDSGKDEVFVSNFGGTSVSVISGVSNSLVGSVRTGPDPEGLTYDPAQDDVYLESVVGGPNESTGRNVSVISDQTDRIVASIPEPGGTNGAGYDPGLSELFVPTYPDEVDVISTLNNSIIETITVGTVPPTYEATFTETGLTPGATWSVGQVSCAECSPSIWTSSTAESLPITELDNGTYDYLIWADESGVSPILPFGQFRIDGANVTVAVTFVSAYTASFWATGLSSQAGWSVTLDGYVELSNGSRAGPFLETHDSSTYGPSLLTFDLPNGTFAYTASAPGYLSISGSLDVRGNEPPPITVSFVMSESGLILGLPWWAWAVIAAGLIGATVATVVRRRRGRPSDRASADPPSQRPG